MKRSHSFKINTSQVKGQEYTMEIPTAGQLIQIERQKSILAGGSYGDILSSRTVGSSYALDIIDMAAYLSVLCPDLFKDLKIDSLMDLDIFDMKQLHNDWTEQCIPWVNQWQKVLREVPKDEKKKESQPASVEQTEEEDGNSKEQ